MLDIDVDEAGRRIDLEGQAGGRAWATGDAMTFEAAVHAAARQLRIHAALQNLDDVVQRQAQALAQLQGQNLLSRVMVSQTMRPRERSWTS